MKKLKNVLLIDDDTITNYLNKELIYEMGITDEVIICSSGDEALDWFKVYNDLKNPDKIDLILLDINMPGIDGFEFLEAFKNLKFNHNIPVVLLTTSDNIRDKTKAHEFNVNGYINKPLNEEKLQKLFNTMLT